MTSSPDSPSGAEPLSTSAFDFELPPHLIADRPTLHRDASRLLVVRRAGMRFEHRTFRDIVDLFDPGDVLVLNETRVIPARLLGIRAGGGEAEIVLLRPDPGPGGGVPDSPPGTDWPHEWTALVRPGAKLKPGRRIRIAEDLDVEILDILEHGTRRIRLHSPLAPRAAIERHGRMPLPPYIQRDAEAADRERYQTVYAKAEGSVAAPTAGLHFTSALLDALGARGVHTAKIVLHVGVGTFRPVEVEDPARHVMHAEWYDVAAAAAKRINAARQAGGRVWAVGTTVTRTLESVVTAEGVIPPGSGWTRLFIRPGYTFRAVDRLITNFHLPRSTLIMLVSAFAGYDLTRAAYAEAVRERYRFYSYGDAMAVL